MDLKNVLLLGLWRKGRAPTPPSSNLSSLYEGWDQVDIFL